MKIGSRSSSGISGPGPRGRGRQARLSGWLFTGLLAAFLFGCSGTLPGGTAAPTVNVPNINSTSQVPTLVRPANAQPLPTSVSNWEALGLSGRILYTPSLQDLRQWDLVTGQDEQIFQGPSNSWLSYAAPSPDGSQIVVAYSPPPESGLVQLGYTSLYLLPGDCAQQAGGCTAEQLTPLRLTTLDNEAYFAPFWSPDGRYLYYARFTPPEAGGLHFTYSLERMAMPAGESEHLANDVLWPAISADGSQLAYVVQSPEDGSNDLYISAADGSTPRLLLEHGFFYAVDAPVFSPDGQHVLFSAVDTAPAAASSRPWGWLDQLQGVQIAEAAPPAHSVPSDWWQVSVDGGPPVRLTQIFDTGLFGDFSPDAKWLGYISQSGFYIMAPDGSELTRLRSDSLAGTMNWMP